MTDENFYVYELYDPSSDQTYYVGKGRFERWKHHERASKGSRGYRDNNKRKLRKVRQIVQTYGYTPVKMYSHLTEEEAFRKEVSLILKYGTTYDGTGSLLNLTKGGEGYSGGKIPVDQYNRDGVFLQTYPSALDAAYTLGTFPNAITSCCKRNKKSRTTAGYAWTYHNETFDFDYVNPHAIHQYDQKGTFLQTFTSLKQAAHSISHTRDVSSDIMMASRNGGLSHGFRWLRKRVSCIVPPKKCKMVICIETSEEFISVKDAATFAGCSSHNIRAVCNGYQQTARNYHFKWKD